ncbi:MAG TPA: APC family permease [Bacteroidota bacterium]|nr:APC family permease [Bacteroidota bacterium]
MLSLQLLFFVGVNIALVGAFAFLMRRKNMLAYFENSRWWLTWLSVAIITLMDELTSIFYAPSEAFRFIGYHAIVFIAVTSILMRLLSWRMTEIAEVLELHGVRGGGVYSFSYLVLGPTISFVAVSSIMVDYVLTASISTVSAVENGMSFFVLGGWGKYIFQLGIIWMVAGLNILGIRENAKVTFGIFLVAAFVLINMLAGGMANMTPPNWHTIGHSVIDVGKIFDNNNWINTYYLIIVGISSCILAYSGIESVVQTAGLVKSWRDVHKAYLFLAFTTGIFTPLLAMVVLSSNIDLSKHETDLITQFAQTVGGVPFGIVVGVMASILLIMAVNTAYVASSELMERVAHRYGFTWIIKTNKRQSLYRVHIGNAIFYTFIITITGGSQRILAEMYALGLIASFTINMGSLLIYRYSKGTSDVRAYNTSRSVTLVLFTIFASSFLYLAYHKPFGMIMWTTVTAAFLVVGLRVAKKRAPEIKHIQQTDVPLNMIFYLAESDTEEIDIYFRRPLENAPEHKGATSVYISLYSPRQGGIPEKMAVNHFRFSNQRKTLYEGITEILYTLDYELPDKKIVVHFGWPLSSWLDRLSTGVMVFSIMRLPKLFPRFTFVIEYFGKPKDSPPPSDDDAAGSVDELLP